MQTACILVETECTSLKYLDEPNRKSVCMKYIGISTKTIQPLMKFEKNIPRHGLLLPTSKIKRLE
jgi:hypothetical protein